ncbi:hypothetical protein D9M68_330710 [compost metagenome]
MRKVRQSPLAYRTLIFSGMRPLTRDTMFANERLQLPNCGTIQAQQALFELRIGVFQRELVGKINNKTRVSA